MKIRELLRAMRSGADFQSFNGGLFYGSEEAGQAFAQSLNALQQRIIDHYSGAPNPIKAYMDDLEEGFGRPGLEVTENGTALIKVNGSLASNVGFFGRLMGMTGYDDIVEQLAMVAERDDVNQALMLFNTPGGNGSGLEAAASVIKQVNNIKPVYGYSSTQSLSAGYWLMSQTRRIYASKMAEIGSIGVFTILVDQSEMLKREGIEARVVRAGEFKAVGTIPVERISEKALEVNQERIDQSYEFFLEAVQEGRGLSRPALINKAAEGRVHFAQAAKDVGLIYGVMTLGEALAKIEKPQKRRGAGNNRGQSAPRQFSHKDRGQDAMKLKKVRVFSNQYASMLAEGVDESVIKASLGENAYELISVAEAKDQGVAMTSENLVSVDEDGSVIEDGGVAADAEANAGTGEGETAGAGEGEGETAGAGEGAPPAAAASAGGEGGEGAPASMGMDGLLNRIADLTTQNAQLNQKLSLAEGRVQAQETAMTQLEEIAVARIQHMQVALNQTPIDKGKHGMGAEALASLHAAVEDKYTKHFRVGRQSAGSEGSAANSGEGGGTHDLPADPSVSKIAGFGQRR